MNTTIIIGIVAYIVGMFPTALLVGRCINHNPLSEGSGNPGASNVYRIGGRAAGIIVGLIDMAKGAIPTLVALLLWDRTAMLAAWVGAILGHIWPILKLLPRSKLRGGKGVATSAGGVLVLDPLLFAICITTFVVVCRLTRIAALASFSVTAVYFASVIIQGRSSEEILTVAVIVLIILWCHRSNLQHLWRGKELKV